MHKVSISQSVIDRVVARRGREHIFDDLDPAKTALVVVDMQNGFMVPETGPCRLPDGPRDRAQHQPAGAGGARHRRHGDLDPDRLSPTRR